MTRATFFLSVLFLLSGSSGISAQTNSLEISPEREKIFTPFMYWRHGGKEGLENFKKDKPHEYLLELWYYTSSFYIKRDYLSEGVRVEEYIIDISRFEQYRKENEEYYLLLPGNKDAIVLLPANKLIYKPAN